MREETESTRDKENDKLADEISKSHILTHDEMYVLMRDQQRLGYYVGHHDGIRTAISVMAACVMASYLLWRVFYNESK